MPTDSPLWLIGSLLKIYCFHKLSVRCFAENNNKTAIGQLCCVYERPLGID